VNNYELTVILRNREVESLKEKLSGILQKHGVTVVKEDSWGTKRLAYMIEEEKEGYYFFAHVQAAPEIVDKVIVDFRLTPDILRFLFVKMNEQKTA